MFGWLKRPADFVITHSGVTYLERWWVIPRNKWFNIYLHHFLRSDEDRALHDHPWINASILVRGSYIEVLPATSDMAGPVIEHVRKPRAVYFRRSTSAHRVKLMKDASGNELPVWTIFLTGPRIRKWGFWCPQGWRRWEDFVKRTPGGNDVGRGCE